MSLDGKILARARDRLESLRRENEAAGERRREEIYAKNPEIRRIDRQLRETMVSAIGAALSGGDALEALAAVKERNIELQERRAIELARMGLPVDYLDERYMCPDCHDTGSRGTEICHCLMDLYKQEQAKELSAILKMGEDTFESFDPTYYDDTPDPETGRSVRDSMMKVYNVCRKYAIHFSENSQNLFLSGGPGLGKTFLSTCIARVVLESGFSVVYETAVSALSKYDNVRFGRGDIDALTGEIERMENCDLLILDDLGAEFATQTVVSSLYTLVNTRLMRKKKTIISSNLSVDELETHYSPAIASRLSGEYTVLPFVGSDIRELRKKRRLTKQEDR